MCPCLFLFGLQNAFRQIVLEDVYTFNSCWVNSFSSDTRTAPTVTIQSKSGDLETEPITEVKSTDWVYPLEKQRWVIKKVIQCPEVQRTHTFKHQHILLWAAINQSKSVWRSAGCGKPQQNCSYLMSDRCAWWRHQCQCHTPARLVNTAKSRRLGSSSRFYGGTVTKMCWNVRVSKRSNI